MFKSIVIPKRQKVAEICVEFRTSTLTHNNTVVVVVVVVVVNFYLNRVAHSALRLVSMGALYLKNSLHRII